MFVITGITGKVGGQVASTLLEQGHRIRAVVRSAEKEEEWAAKGCEVSVASLDDATALTEAFRDAEGVFLLTPPNYDPEPGFPDTVRKAEAIRLAIEATQPKKLVFLSTVGAHVPEFNLLNNSGMTEAMLRTVSVPVAFLRAAWFMENAAWDVADARRGIMHSFLQPLDHKIPMIATKDIAEAAVELLHEPWRGVRVVELEAPQRYSANDIAAAFANVLGSPVHAESVPRASWEGLFRSQGTSHPPAAHPYDRRLQRGLDRLRRRNEHCAEGEDGACNGHQGAGAGLASRSDEVEPSPATFYLGLARLCRTALAPAETLAS